MEIFEQRRAKLISQLADDAVFILPSARMKIRNGDVEHPFRQDSDFYYLTGFNEKDALLVLIPGRPQGQFILFNQAKDEAVERWTGPQVGQVQAVELYGADQAYPIEDCDKVMAMLLENKEVIYCPITEDSRFDHKLSHWVKKVRAKIRSGIKAPATFKSSRPILAETRLIKSAAEIEWMQKAADISVQAHIKAMKACRPKMREYELEAIFLAEFTRQGSRSPAYSSIVGGGANSCILHYIANDQALNKGDLVLIDAGAEYQHYASDITRTFPVDGQFSAAQQAIYELVLQTQLAVIDLIKPGIYWNELQELAIKIMTQGLVNLEILSGDVASLIKEKAYLRFYMHNIGHWLGTDVHDVGAYKINGTWRQLQPGMVLTVEPGIYINAGQANVAEKWWNIGVRIEDDVLVTENGSRVLTAALPKSVEEIQSVMNSHD